MAVNSASWGQKNYKQKYMCDNTTQFLIPSFVSHIQKCEFSLFSV